MKKKLKKYAYNSPIIDVDNKQFVLDYDACGSDHNLHINIELFGKLIQKHFTITFTELLHGMVVYHYV